MKRSLYFTSPLACGAIAAAALHFFLPHSTPERRVTVSAQKETAVASTAVEKLPLTSSEPDQALLQAAIRDSIPVVLLAQPMVIIRGHEYSGLELPRGTRLEVIQNRGDYLEVRYSNSVITIPRSAALRGTVARLSGTVRI